jgi:predicted nucleic acid-binding protein
MCIVIDTNTIVAVFDNRNNEHAKFRPVLDWIISGKGKMVIGGSKYREEVFVKIRKYNRLIKHLQSKRKIVEIPPEEVDREESRIQTLETSPDFDDAHLIALLDVSGCLLICSNDKRAYPFLKKIELYQRRTTRPKIYGSPEGSRDNADLLCDANIAPCCDPKLALNKADQDGIAMFMSH